MSIFKKIIIDKKNNEYKNLHYLPQVISLYEKFSNYLHDDYFLKDRSPIDTVLSVVEHASPYFWAIIDKKASKLAGFVFLDNWVGSSDISHSAEITTCFNPRYWGPYTKFCAKKFIKYCFKKYGLKKLKANIFPQNSKVKTLLKRAGFKKEAILKGETLKNGELQDIEVFFILKNDTKIIKKGDKNEV